MSGEIYIALRKFTYLGKNGITFGSLIPQFTHLYYWQ